MQVRQATTGVCMNFRSSCLHEALSLPGQYKKDGKPYHFHIIKSGAEATNPWVSLVFCQKFTESRSPTVKALDTLRRIADFVRIMVGKTGGRGKTPRGNQRLQHCKSACWRSTRSSEKSPCSTWHRTGLSIETKWNMQHWWHTLILWVNMMCWFVIVLKRKWLAKNFFLVETNTEPVGRKPPLSPLAVLGFRGLASAGEVCRDTDAGHDLFGDWNREMPRGFDKKTKNNASWGDIL